jgi:hypothetical protein
MNNPESPYHDGWDCGRFDGRPGTYCKALPKYHELDRLRFWQGHRAGRAVREMLHGAPVGTVKEVVA